MPAIAVLRAHGTVVVDPADIPSVVDKDERRNLLLWSICSGVSEGKGQDSGCSVVFKYGMKRDFNKWLQSLGERAPLKSLAELRHWNADHQKAGAIKYGQSLRDISDDMQVEADRARNEADRAKDVELAGTHGIQEVMKSGAIDALVFPAASGAARRAPRLSDGDRAVRARAERADAGLPRRLRGAARALRRELHRARLQRAAPHRARLRLRAGDEAPAASGTVSLIQPSTATLAGNPIVGAASGTSCSISASVTPASSALRTAECTALSRCAPMAIASFASRCARASSGPAAASSLTRAQARPSRGKRRTNSW
jgi:hypothetical protein